MTMCCSVMVSVVSRWKFDKRDHTHSAVVQLSVAKPCGEHAWLATGHPTFLHGFSLVPLPTSTHCHLLVV